MLSLIQPVNIVEVKTFVRDLHPGAQCAHGWKIFDRELDSLGCCRKPAIP